MPTVDNSTVEARDYGILYLDYYGEPHVSDEEPSPEPGATPGMPSAPTQDPEQEPDITVCRDTGVPDVEMLIRR